MPGQMLQNNNKNWATASYRAFHGFVQAKLVYGALILGSSQFTLLPSCL